MTDTQSDRTTLHRYPARGRHDFATIGAILDEGFFCHVGFVVNGQPYVIPTGYGRVDRVLYLHGSAASRMTPAQLPRDLITRTAVLHLSGISLAISATALDTCMAAIDAARQAGVAVSFDTNLRLRLWTVDRARAAMTAVLQQTDIALPSMDDMTALTGQHEPEAIVDHCLALGAKVVALKLGDKGALVADAHERHRIPPHPCTPVDATGAGDAFGGAFVARRVAGDSLLAAGRYAAVAAALSTQGYGAVEPIPRAADVRAALRG